MCFMYLTGVGSVIKNKKKCYILYNDKLVIRVLLYVCQVSAMLYMIV